MADEEGITPAEVYQAGQGELGIRWNDGHESIYACDYLRKNCRCAGCIDEMSGKTLLDPNQISPDIHPVQVTGVGRYGIRINWSDRHNTGIYSFHYLRQICPCHDCTQNARN